MSNVTVAPRLSSLNPIRKAMAHLSVYAGLSLIPLLFIGMYLGFAGFWFDYAFFAHLAILFAAVAATLVLYWRVAHRAELSIILTLGGFVVFAVLIALEISHPIIANDALLQHLAVPKWWLEAGQIVPISWHEWSFHPMLLQLGFTGLMKQGLVQLTPLYHACFLILLCGVVTSFTLYKTQNYNAASLSFLLCFTIPVCVQLASSPLIELGLALYFCQALCHLVYWTEGKRKTSHLLISGACFGLALSCAYSGLLACTAAFIAAAIYARRAGVSFGTLFSVIFICGSSAVLVYFPWLFKNASWTNDPFYPLLSQVFSSAQGKGAGIELSPLAQRLFLAHEGWLEIISIPLQMLFLGQDGSAQNFGGILSPILLLALVPLYQARKEAWILFFALCSLLYFLSALCLNPADVRYVAPLYGPVSILCAIGVWQLSRLWNGRFARETYLCAASFALLWSGWHTGNMLASSNVLFYLHSGESQRQYLRQQISEYPAIEYVNATVPKPSIIYVLNTNNRFFYINKRVFSGGQASASQLLRWVRQADNAGYVTAEFRNRGIDYLLMDNERTNASMLKDLNEDERKVWDQFQSQQLELLFTHGAFTVWKIHDANSTK